MSKTKLIVGIVLLYVLSTAGAYGVFGYLGSSGRSVELTSPLPTTMDGILAIDPSAPRTEECPLNGKLFTKVEKESWEQRRPLAVMIENHLDARPQSGLSSADVVYEAIAEGGITRFMGVFYCGVVAKDTYLAPVRSARTYFLDWASEYGKYPLYVHVGGANVPGPADALGQIQSYGWGGRNGNDMNQFSLGYPTFWRDYERLGHTVATEHTMTTSTERLWKAAKDRGWTSAAPDKTKTEWTSAFTPWKFRDAVSADKRGTTSSVAFDFWEGFKQYDVRWDYDAATNSYKRTNGGEAHIDYNTKQQIMTTNVVVLFAKEKGPIDDHKHMLYGTTGQGSALFFQDGQVTEGFWSKKSRIDRTLFTNKKGQPIEFTRGPIWIEVVATDTHITY